MRPGAILTLVPLALLVACDNVGNNDAIDEKSMALARNNGCFACHALHATKIGPPWYDIAKRYRNAEGARKMLIRNVSKGSSDSWNNLTGGAVMPPNSPRVSDKDIARLVDFILSLGKK